MKNRRELMSVYLESHGFRQVKRTVKYWVYAKDGWINKYYLGRSGAVRKGQNVTSSISMTGRINWAKIDEEVREVTCG